LSFANEQNPQLPALPPGMIDHGVAVPMSRARGVAATADGNGNQVILIWLADRGCRNLLMVDANTGKGEIYSLQIPYRDSPYAMLLSRKNRFYSLFADHLVEFDPSQGSISFFGKGAGGAAMAITEDQQGIIWAANYPGSHLISFDPAARKMINYGPVNHEDWPQHARGIAIDNSG